MGEGPSEPSVTLVVHIPDWGMGDAERLSESGYRSESRFRRGL